VSGTLKSGSEAVCATCPETKVTTTVCEINLEIEIAHRAISFVIGMDPGEMGLPT
jgi:hypothetical protein